MMDGMINALMLLGAEVIRRHLNGDDKEVVHEDAVDTLARVSNIDRDDVYINVAVAMAASWAACGFPMVEPGHRLAASFMATSFGFAEVDNSIMPWLAFGIRIPGGLLPEGPLTPTHLLISREPTGDKKRVGIMELRRDDGDKGSIIGMQFEESIWGYTNLDPARLKGFNFKTEVPLSATDVEKIKRQKVMLGRLVVGVCAEMANVQRPAARPRPRHVGLRHMRADPTTWTFKLSRPIVVDARPYVCSYINGASGKAPSVQVLVRGHWKNQPCGPGYVNRRYIHIEPYWRGPEDAPIAVHNYTIGKENV